MQPQSSRVAQPVAHAARRHRAHPGRRARRHRVREGAILVETLIAFLPVLFAFFGALQVIELFTAGLLVRRAAAASVRAAVVVFSDDPKLYTCDNGPPPTGSSSAPAGANACMFGDVVRAARLVLAAGHGFAQVQNETPAEVHITGSLSGHNLITAEVRATYRCFVPPFGFACGLDHAAQFSARASLPYQGADYDYAP